MKKKFVLAPDSFKESLSALEVCQAMEKGIKKVFPKAEIISMPMADGGEGTTDALIDATGGRRVYKKVQGSFANTNVEAYFGILGNSNTAVIEMAKANGLELVALEDRNPMITSTYGTGQLIKAAMDEGVDKIIIGIGGSATNDGGSGMARALGAKFLNKDQEEIPLGGGFLKEVRTIDMSDFDPRVEEIEILIATDVTNPLTGNNGASYVFGPQKGATPEMVKLLDDNLRHYAGIIKSQLGKDVLDAEGAGAAGGLGAGLMAFLNGTLKKGIEMVIEYAALEEKVKDADMVWTGEGSIDFQTQYGKTPLGVATVAKKYDKPVVAFAGRVGDDIDVLYEKGIDSIFGIMKGVTSIEEALAKGQENIEKTAESVIRLMNLK